ncbi:hypothetical protein LTR53_006487 [Teratosphaeriaceae sp. CCFEE 6253]|nr:hypothetical protein LTR53_006487 [Teratosphaeriaceae sp. CCFEE 6253]
MEASPFSTLCAELRNEIYEHVVSQPEAISLRYDPGRGQFFATVASSRPATTMTDDPDMFAITRVCRVFRAESTALVYAVNTFNFQTRPPSPDIGMERAAFHDFDKLVSLLPAPCARLLQPTLVLDCRLPGVGFFLSSFLRGIEKRTCKDRVQSLHVHVIYYERPSEASEIHPVSSAHAGMTMGVDHTAPTRCFDLNVRDVASTRASCDVALARLMADAMAAKAVPQETLLCMGLRHYLRNEKVLSCAVGRKRPLREMSGQ